MDAGAEAYCGLRHAEHNYWSGQVCWHLRSKFLVRLLHNAWFDWNVSAQDFGHKQECPLGVFALSKAKKSIWSEERFAHSYVQFASFEIDTQVHIQSRFVVVN